MLLLQVSTIITGLLSFMNDTAPTLGSINSSDAEKRILARKSKEFNLKVLFIFNGFDVYIFFGNYIFLFKNVDITLLLQDRVFCELFSDLAKQIREELAEEQSKVLTEENAVDETTPQRRFLS